jgi:hypothetical protein
LPSDLWRTELRCGILLRWPIFILHGDGTRWTRSDSGASTDLVALWGSSAAGLWAVGSGGTALHDANH